MATFSLDYKLKGAGWAVAVIENKTESATMNVSYLHDSLYDIAVAAKSLIHGSISATVLFMDEPGEHQLIFFKRDNSIYYEVRWFDDWASWNMHPPDKYAIVLEGKTTLKRVTGEIFNTLKNLYDEYSPDMYVVRDSWTRVVKKLGSVLAPLVNVKQLFEPRTIVF